MNKKFYDERQQQDAERNGRKAFEGTFFVLAAVIIAQMILAQGDVRQVLGETIAILAGGGIYLGLTVKDGNLNRHTPRVMENLIISLSCGVFFALLFIVTMYLKTAGRTSLQVLGIWGAGCMVLFFVLGMAVLTILAKSAERRQKKMEEKYDE